jgi:serine protease AprX
VWGGITAPGSFPWVFTVGASSSKGSFTRGDDERAAFSSRGPAFPLQIAKPDILAGGVGIESTAVPGSALYEEGARANPSWLVHGAFPTAHLPYLALTGTSQAAAVVSGVAAQMLQANPRLTPNLIKAILEYLAGLRRLQPARAGRRLPQRARSRSAVSFLRDRAQRSACAGRTDLEQAFHLG